MAAENPPYAIAADSHGAELFRRAVASLLPSGLGGLSGALGCVIGTGDMLVTAGAGNTVSVAAGEAWIPGSVGAAQGLYYAYNDAAVSLTITPNASNPLYAIVTASVNDQAYSGNPGVTSNEWGLLVTQGTPSSSPVVPATPNDSLLLATILVPANASSSSSYTITDNRNKRGTYYRSSVYKASAETINNGSLTGITFDTAVHDPVGSWNLTNGIWTCPQAGLYVVTGTVTADGTTGCLLTQIYKNGSVWRQCGQVSYNSGQGTAVAPIQGQVQVAAGDTVKIVAYQNSGSSSAVATGATNTACDICLLAAA